MQTGTKTTAGGGRKAPVKHATSAAPQRPDSSAVKRAKAAETESAAFVYQDYRVNAPGTRQSFSGMPRASKFVEPQSSMMPSTSAQIAIGAAPIPQVSTDTRSWTVPRAL